MFDILIKHGRVIDGTGNPWIASDVGIVSGRIDAVVNSMAPGPGKSSMPGVNSSARGLWTVTAIPIFLS